MVRALMPFSWFSVPVFALAALALLSCSRFERAHECLSLADKVNPTLDRIERMAKEPASPERQRKLAALYRDLGERVKAAPASYPELSAALRGYGDVLLETASVLEKWATGVAARPHKKNKPKARAAPALASLAKLETVRRREAIQVERINRLCRRP